MYAFVRIRVIFAVSYISNKSVICLYIARRYIQGRVSVHLSVTHRCCVETEEPVIIQSIQPAVPPCQVMDYYFLILSHKYPG